MNVLIVSLTPFFGGGENFLRQQSYDNRKREYCK